MRIEKPNQTRKIVLSTRKGSRGQREKNKNQTSQTKPNKTGTSQMMRRETGCSQDVSYLGLWEFFRSFAFFCLNFCPSYVSRLQWHSPCSISLAGFSHSSRSRLFSATFGWVFVQHVGEFGPAPQLVIQVQNTGIWKFTPAALTEPGKCQWNNIPEKSQLLCAAQRLFCSAACWFPIHSSLSPSPLLHFSIKSKKLA